MGVLKKKVPESSFQKLEKCQGPASDRDVWRQEEPVSGALRGA